MCGCVGKPSPAVTPALVIILRMVEGVSGPRRSLENRKGVSGYSRLNRLSARISAPLSGWTLSTPFLTLLLRQSLQPLTRQSCDSRLGELPGDTL
jgi:hypothetical protein